MPVCEADKLPTLAHHFNLYVSVVFCLMVVYYKSDQKLASTQPYVLVHQNIVANTMAAAGADIALSQRRM